MASVLDVRTAEHTAAAAAVTAAQQALAQADATAVADQGAVAAATDALAALQTAAAAIEAALAAATMPADQHHYETQLEANMLQRLPAEAALAKAQDTLSSDVLARQRAAADLDRARAGLTAAQAALTAATADDDAANTWRILLQGPVLAATITTAGEQATTDLVNAALANLTTWLGDPSALAMVQSRYADATSSASDLVDAVDRETAARDALAVANEPAAGTMAQTAHAFAAARDAARWPAELAVPQLAWALAQLGAVKNGTGAPTTAEQGLITTRAQAAAAGPAVHETTVHEDSVALREANAAFDRKALLAEAADPNFDRNTDPSLTAERDAVQQATQNLQNAEAAYPQNESDVVDQWEVALPDTLVQATADTLRAIGVVDRVKAVSGANTVQALDNAESAYATAIQAADALADRYRAADDRLAAATDAVTAAAAVADQRLVASVRGA